MKKVDARGQQCPQPVMMTREALASAPEAIQVTVDNAIAGQNVSRFLTSQGYAVKLSAENDDIIIEGTKAVSSPAPAKAECQPARALKPAMLITHQTLGGNDAELGEVLIKGLLGTLSQLDDLRPAGVALMNEGVKLAVRGTPTCEALNAYEKAGGSVLVCGTCLKHFGLTDSIGVGVVSNMFEIVSTMLASNAVCL